MHATKKNHHSKAETISKLTVNSQLQNDFSRAKIKILTLPVNVHTLEMVSELKAHYPSYRKIDSRYKF